MTVSYSSEIHRILKLGGQKDPHFNGAPESLPVAENDGGSHMTHMPTIAGHSAAGVGTMPRMNSFSVPRISFRGLLVYPVIFLAAFVFFYAVLNFGSILAQVEGFFSPPQAQQILGDDSAAFYKWISNYFYAVGDPKLLEPANDMDKDGLANYDEFILRTNPMVADSDSDGFSDGIEVTNNYNPWGLGALSAQQKNLSDKLDLILINNRISFNSAPTNSGIVAGANTFNYDLDRAGQLSIPKLKLQVPLIWSKDPDNFETDLTKGVVHYPGTALPGENGIIYVSGHSSDYIWKKDPMQNVFAKLNFLAAGDDIFVDVYGKDGKVYNYRYQVTVSNVYKPNDQAQFFDSSNQAKLNLSTCWPIGTSTNRIVVTAVPVGL